MGFLDPTGPPPFLAGLLQLHRYTMIFLRQSLDLGQVSTGPTNTIISTLLPYEHVQFASLKFERTKCSRTSRSDVSFHQVPRPALATAAHPISSDPSGPGSFSLRSQVRDSRSRTWLLAQISVLFLRAVGQLGYDIYLGPGIYPSSPDPRPTRLWVTCKSLIVIPTLIVPIPPRVF